jgi:hypothetical protein
MRGYNITNGVAINPIDKGYIPSWSKDPQPTIVLAIQNPRA